MKYNIRYRVSKLLNLRNVLIRVFFIVGQISYYLVVHSYVDTSADCIWHLEELAWLLPGPPNHASVD